jgi:hypothetical protein
VLQPKSLFQNIVPRFRQPWPVQEQLLLHLEPVNRALVQKLKCDCFTRFTAKCPNPLCRVSDVKQFCVQVIPMIIFHSDEPEPMEVDP